MFFKSSIIYSFLLLLVITFLLTPSKAFAENITLFSDNIEQGLNGWTAAGSTGASPSGQTLWHISQRSSMSPTHSWYYGKEDTGNYDTGYRNWGYLTSQAISIPADVQSVTLQFDQLLITQNSASPSATSYLDTAKVELSKDAVTWTPYVTLPENPGWQTVYIGIPSSYFGSTTYIRFYFDTIDNAANNYEGWYIDNIILNAVIPTPTPTPICDRSAQISLLDNSIPKIYPAGTANNEFIIKNLNDPQCTPTTYSIGKGYPAGWTFNAPSFVTLNGGETKQVPFSITAAVDAPARIFNYTLDANGVYGTTGWVEVIIPNNPPHAYAGPDQNGFTNQTLYFDSYPSYDEEGPITFLWDFGDGSTSTEAKPSHAYSVNKTYTVTLTVTDQEGLSSQDSLRANIVNDTVTITKAVYSTSKKQLTVEASSNSNGAAALTLVGIGQMTYDPASNLYRIVSNQARMVESVAVSSSFGGSSASPVTKVAK